MSKVALVTGASRGLGFALAEALAATHHIVAVARTTGSLEALDDRIQAAGGAATLAPMDITNRDAMAQLCRSVHDRWGSVDIWVHTAVHGAPLAPANHIDRKDWDRSMSINAGALGHLVPFVAPLLGQDGRAVFFDDTFSSGPFHGAYAASKAAQLAFVRTWQAEAVKTGPRVMIETPPPMPTMTRARFHPGEDRDTLTPVRDVAQEMLARIVGA